MHSSITKVISMIPKKIHLIYRSRMIPGKYQPFYERMQSLHPDWEITVYDDQDAAQIVSSYFPGLQEIYAGYKLDVQRTDLLRVLLVYLFGGFYLDLDILPRQEFDSLCGYDLVLGEERTFTPEECLEYGKAHSLRIANYMFGSVAGHEFWLGLINEAAERSKMEVACEEDVLDSTGPGLMTDVYHIYKDVYPDIKLIRNVDSLCLRSCEAICCHFGEYAAHLHFGSWRWESK